MTPRDPSDPGQDVGIGLAVGCAVVAPLLLLAWAALVWLLAQRPPLYWVRVVVLLAAVALLGFALSHIEVKRL